IAAVRSGRRVVGTPPVFPSASVVLSRQLNGLWTDIAFADETPEAEVPAAAIGLGPGSALAAYLVSRAGGAECRIVELPLTARPVTSSAWRKLPPYPQEPGMAGPMVGIDRGTLLALGGANFPDRPPWDGGIKRYYDPVFALAPGARAWAEVGRLPVPRAYGATVSVTEGIFYAGGENADEVFQDTVFAQGDARGFTLRAGPRLPAPITSAAAVALGRHIYLAGGYGPGMPRISRNCFWRLDLDRPGQGWEELPTWPGPTRALAVMAAVAGAVYVISGIEVRAKPGGANQETEAPEYLRDAYRFDPRSGWERLPDLPWSVLAAPSPAPVTTQPPRVWVLGGVDGRQVGRLPRATPLPNDLLYFDVASGAWKHGAEPWPTPVVCIPSFATPDGWVLATGETMAGRRTTAVRQWQPPS
ncbi:MAG TPA: hypothetical protein PLB90_12445, partial [Opitutaceae bacterium]|nr:hypothetical protein [Opitutaceae bacterium]